MVDNFLNEYKIFLENNGIDKEFVSLLNDQEKSLLVRAFKRKKKGWQITKKQQEFIDYCKSWKMIKGGTNYNHVLYLEENKNKGSE